MSESAERFVIEAVFVEYGAHRVYELIDRLTGRVVRRSQTRSVLADQLRRYNLRHDNGLDPYGTNGL
jgi:hypothetical protein